MIDVFRIQQGIDGLKQVKDPDARLKIARGLFSDVQKAEAEIARDFSIPFDTVSRLRALIPVIEPIVNRLEAGAKKRRENAAGDQ